MADTEKMFTMSDLNLNTEHAKIAGGVLLGGLTLLTLNEWVAILTIVYLSFQIGLLIPKYIALFKSWKNRRGS